METKKEQTVLEKSIIEYAENLDVKKVLLYLGIGANVNIMDDQNESLLTIAAKTGRFDRVPFYLESFLSQVKDKEKVAKILAMKKRLENAGIDFSDGGSGHGTLDHYIMNLADYTSEERIEFMKVLLEHGADINLLGKDGLNSMYYAVSRGDYKLVDFLIKNGADCTINYYPDEPPIIFENMLEKAYLDLQIAESNYRDSSRSILFDGMDRDLFEKYIDGLKKVVVLLENEAKKTI